MLPYHKFKFNNCEKKEVNLRSLYFTYFPNYVCNLQYDTNKKLYKSAISHPIGLVEVTQDYLNLTVAITRAPLLTLFF